MVKVGPGQLKMFADAKMISADGAKAGLQR